MSMITFEYEDKSYTMSEEAIEAAYRYQQRQYMLNDAESHLRALAFGWGSEDDYTPGEEVVDEEIQNALEEFEAEYGVPFDEALKHLEEYVMRFNDNFNQELSEDDQWDNAIEAVLSNFTAGNKKSTTSGSVIRVTDIDWDVEDEEEREDLGLPVEVVIDEPTVEMLEDVREDNYADSIGDYLSDTYGFCVKGFSAEIEE